MTFLNQLSPAAVLVISLITSSMANAEIRVEEIRTVPAESVEASDEETHASPGKTSLPVEPTDTGDGSKVHVEMHPKGESPIRPEEKPKKAAALKPTSAPAKKSVTGETALGWLKNGNTRYLKNIKRADGRSANDRKRLVAGQTPHALVLSCSDSRVPPEMIFDQALGEISVVRVLGPSLDSAAIASVEDAVENQGVNLIVVMGHSHCSAIKGALDSRDNAQVVSTYFDSVYSDIKPRLKTIKDSVSTTLEVESAVNADGVARELVRRSDVVRKKVEANQLIVKSALYRLENGKVDFY